MRNVLLALAGTLIFSACSISSSPPPPANNTIVVPQGSTAICSDGSQPPCR